MATRVAIKRLTLEYKTLTDSPTPYIETHPTEQDILQWYFVITGPPDTPFEGGQYLGSLTFPPSYPMAPPAIRMLTPSGRFEPGSRLCLSMSDFHPEHWNPAWNVSTILTGLLSFMCSNEIATGAIVSHKDVLRSFARASVKWNLKNEIFRKEFPNIVERVTASVPDIDAVEHIDVVPPKPSELLQHITCSYRPSAHLSAQHHAKTSMLQEVREEKKANEEELKKDEEGSDPKKDGQTWMYVASAVAAVLVAILLFK